MTVSRVLPDSLVTIWALSSNAPAETYFVPRGGPSTSSIIVAVAASGFDGRGPEFARLVPLDEDHLSLAEELDGVPRHGGDRFAPGTRSVPRMKRPGRQTELPGRIARTTAARVFSFNAGDM